MDDELQRAMMALRQGGLKLLPSLDLLWLHTAIDHEFAARAAASGRSSGLPFQRDLMRLEDAIRVPAQTPPTRDPKELQAFRDVAVAALAGLQSSDQPSNTPEGQEISFHHDRLLKQVKDLDQALPRRDSYYRLHVECNGCLERCEHPPQKAIVHWSRIYYLWLCVCCNNNGHWSLDDFDMQVDYKGEVSLL